MITSTIVSKVNKALAGMSLSMDEIDLALDSAIADINSELHAQFPTMSEFLTAAETTDYTAIPDKYITSVVVIGAAYYFYLYDEEGIGVSPGLQMMYVDNLFRMIRDYAFNVPEEYRNPSSTSTIPKRNQDDPRGITIGRMF